MLKFKKLVLGLTSVVALGVTFAAHAETARLGTNLPDGHPQSIGAKKFAELVKEKTNGAVTVQVFTNGILGNDVNMTTMLQSGTLQFSVPSSATVASINPDFSILSLPFQFDSYAKADHVMDGKVGQDLLKSLDAKKLVGLGFWENGFRQITNSRNPINTLEDLKGLKMRTMQNAMYIDLFKDLGANAIPLPVNELFTALETRTVDGQENPYTVVEAQHFYDVQKYLSNTSHAYDALVLLASKDFMDKLSEANRAGVIAAAKEATAYQRQVSRDMNGALLAQLAKKMKINDVTEAERNKMKVAVQPLVDKYKAKLSPQVVAEFNSELAKN